MKVLYVNHTSRVSGAERSLLDLLSDLPREVEPRVVCPVGELEEAVSRLGVPVTRIRGTDGSLRIHPLHTARGVVQMARGALELRIMAKQTSADLIHANSIRAGLVASLAVRLGGPPVLVHLRDCLPPTGAATLVRSVVLHGASLLIANSNHTAASFVQTGFGARVLTSYDRVDLSRFSPQTMTRAEARVRLGLDDTVPVLGVIGQLTPWKGQDDAIRILARVRSVLSTACLLVVGRAIFTAKATRYDNLAYAQSLNQLASDFALNGSVRFLGEREDIPVILRALDVLLLPSWEEPFGRTVIEAMAMEVPVVATNVGGPAELITDGVDGILLPPKQPERWAATIGDLLGRPADLRDMGRRARQTAVKFGSDGHVVSVLDAYRTVLQSSSN